MADNEKVTMTFVPGAKLADLPKRETPTRTFNREAAEALLGVVKPKGSTATDGELHEKRESATKKAASAKRLLAHVLPEDKRSRTRVYTLDGESGFRWAIWLVDAPADKNGKK